MACPEKFFLQWKDFKDTISLSFGELRGERELSNVTLVSEDGKQEEVHKVVLASASPFFLALLKRNRHPHPLIYMRNVKSEDLTNIIDFLYFGEVSVFQEHLEPFLALAADFKLKGLTGAFDDSKPEAPIMSSPIIKEDTETNKENTNFEIQTVNKMVLVKSQTCGSGGQDLDDLITSMMTKSEVSLGNGRGKMAKCKVCGKEAAYHDMPKHIEANHITGVSHFCDMCGQICKTRNGMEIHKRVHKNPLSLLPK